MPDHLDAAAIAHRMLKRAMALPPPALGAATVLSRGGHVPGGVNRYELRTAAPPWRAPPSIAEVMEAQRLAGFHPCGYGCGRVTSRTEGGWCVTTWESQGSCD